jgi:SulP family sulfate permease
MITTFLATMFLPLQFAVIIGILLSFAVYILRTSVPRVEPVLPADNFRHFSPQGEREPCPQMSILDIFGDLYFGAVSHVEESLRMQLEHNPGQRFMLLRMFSVDQIDISGVHALESIIRTLRERGGDLYMMRTQQPIVDLMKSIGFYDSLGPSNFLEFDNAITHLFHRVLDPAICIYECETRVFLECQNLPRPAKHPIEGSLPMLDPKAHIKGIDPVELWNLLHQPEPPIVIDVREPREFIVGHIKDAISIPLITLLTDTAQIPKEKTVTFVCRSGRRSTRAVFQLGRQGFENVQVMTGGMLAWEAAGLLVAVE